MRLIDAFLSARKLKENSPRAVNRTGSSLWTEHAKQDEAMGEYPRPQMARIGWINLNGNWQYAFTQEAGRPEKFEGKIRVPFSPECSLSGVGRTLMPKEYLWYFRSVEIPEIKEKQHLLLHFGAVDERCFIWWNGKLLGSHRGGYLPFSFDVTEHLAEGKNTLWLRVEDDTDTSEECRGKQSLNSGGMFYTAQSGIWQTVWMEWVPEKFLDGLRITPSFDKKNISLELRCSEPLDGEVTIQCDNSTYTHRITKKQFELESDSRRYTDTVTENAYLVGFTMDLPEFHPWSPEDPYLYDLKIRMGEDSAVSYFAIRKYSLGHDAKHHPRLMLNGKPYLFNGVLDQGYWPESLYTPPCDDAMIYDIQTAKKIGFNTIRKHLKIEPLRWYYHCDRLGMVVWQDMVNGGGKISMLRMCYLPTLIPEMIYRVSDSHRHFFCRTDRGARQRWEEDCIAMVAHLYNSPCVGMWVPFNEGWGQFDSRRIASMIRERDNTRFIDHASGWYDQRAGDVKSVHNYFRKLRVVRDRRPCVLSEYGGAVLYVKDHSDAKEGYGYHTCKNKEEFRKLFNNHQNKIQKLEAQGLSGAVYTQLTDIEDEQNGILTYDRKVNKLEV